MANWRRERDGARVHAVAESMSAAVCGRDHAELGATPWDARAAAADLCHECSGIVLAATDRAIETTAQMLPQRTVGTQTKEERDGSYETAKASLRALARIVHAGRFRRVPRVDRTAARSRAVHFGHARNVASSGSALTSARAGSQLVQHHYVRLDGGFGGPIELTLRAILEVAGPDAPELLEFWNLVSFCRARYADSSKPTKIGTPELMAAFDNNSTRWRRAELVIRAASWFFQKSGDLDWQVSRQILEFVGAHDIEGYIKAEAELRASVHGSYVDPTVMAPTASPTPVVDLWQRPLPSGTDPEIGERMRRAQELFARPGASVADHRDAVRALADVLEMLRPRLVQAISAKDEDTLFEIINKFGIRHANQLQQDDYDALWLFWMFHFFGATIYVVLWRLDDLAKAGANQ